MTTKTNVGLFLMTGLVLAFAAIYTLPMQQAAACGKSCDGGGGGGDDCCGGSLVNVEDNDIGSNIGNVKTGDTLSGNKIGNVKTGDILSGNKIKALNDNNIGNIKDVNVLSKNYLKDVNVLSKNYNNKFLNNILSDNFKTGDVIHYYDENDQVKVPIVSGNTLNAFKLLGCGC